MSEKQTYQPFPGLRAYGLKESRYFSGRDRQKHQLLKIINDNNFVAVVGGNGVGKTSFVNSEIIPELMQGFLSKGKSSWKVVSFRPGKNSIGALATALSHVEVVQSLNEDKIDPNLNEQFETILRQKNYSIIEIVEKYKITENNNLLIYIDHLDDLLFYARNASESSKREVEIFIERLVEVVNQSAYAITVIVTLRTEIVGHFSIFPELAEIINKNQFLLSAYNARDLLPIFEKIVKEGVLNFDKDLLRHIRQFYKNNPLVLGEFQHAMRKSVDQWRKEGGKGSITLEHLDAVGGLNATIAYQLDNIFGYLSFEDKQTCRLLFQAITETSSADTSFSVPRSIREISEITGRSSDDIIKVAQLFSNKGCGVIKRYNPQDITGRLEYLNYARDKSENLITEHTEITIAQDFLLEVWPRLHKWIKEEYLNSNIYRDIVRDVERNDPPYEGEKLLATWKWYEEVQPHAGWAKRYYKNFGLAEEFILRSKHLSDKEQDRREAEELSRQQKSRRNRNIKLAFSLVALILTGFAFVKTRQASKEAYKANEQQKIAEEAQKKAQKAKEEAAYDKRTAELSIAQSSRDREIAQEALDSAKVAKRSALIAKKEAFDAQKRAQSLRLEADRLTTAVTEKTQELGKAEEKIEKSVIKEEYLGILEAVRDASDEATKILSRTNNPEQRKAAAKTASDAYAEFQKINQEKYKDIQDTTKENTQKKLFSALTMAYQKVGGSQNLSNVFYGISLSKNKKVASGYGSGEFLLGANDNNSSIYKVAIQNGIVEKPNSIASAKNSEKKIMGIKELSFSNSSEHFIVSHLPIDQTNRYISKYDADGNAEGSIEMPSLVEGIYPYQEDNFIAVDQNGNLYLISAGTSQLRSSKLFKSEDQLRAIDFHEPSNKVFLAMAGRKIILLDLTSGKATESDVYELNDFESEISAIKYIDSKNWIVIGTRNGEIYVYNAISKNCIYKSLNEHAGNINCLVVSDNDNIMVSGGRDKIINIWDLKELSSYTSGKSNADKVYQPAELEEEESIRDVAFLNENWILVVYSTEGLTSGKGGASLLPLDFDIIGRELEKLVK